MTYVVLQNITDESAGEYKCQVSGEGPLFNTEILSKRLRVAGKYISYLIDKVLSNKRMIAMELKYIFAFHLLEYYFSY